MYRIAQDAKCNLPDTAAFVETLNALEQSPVAEARRLFDPQIELTVARAPGRLDVMGGIADYSGSLVLELPIQEATFVALQRDPSRRLTIVSLSDSGSEGAVSHVSLSEFESPGNQVDYEAARTRFQQDPSRHWAAYVAGVFLVLMRERNIRFRDGARILIASRVPQGKGVSSSAALEVAVMQAVSAAFEIPVGPRELALLCQIAENCVAGAPSGVMDQMTAACGENNRLLALLCQPAELIELVEIPHQVALWGLDSGVRHSISGTDYGSVRIGAFMGYRIIAELAGLSVEIDAPGTPARVVDPYWGGYLANITASEFDELYAARLPERIRGREFLSLYGGTTDTATRIVPDQTYAVRVPAAHAVHEHRRVRMFRELLQGVVTEARLEALGDLMYQSHRSYSACELGSKGTDLLVELVQQAGPREGLYGAKITGGGSGGTVAVLSECDAAASIARIADRYSQLTGYRPYVFTGSSPGSVAFGHLKLVVN